MSPVWAAVAMLVQNVLAVFLVQAEARNRALLAGLLDCLMWPAGMVTTTITVTALQGHHAGLKGELIAQACALGSKDARIVVTAIAPFDQMDVQLNLFNLAMFNQAILGTVFGSQSPRVQVPNLLNLFEAGELKIDEIITQEYSLDQVQQGYEDQAAGTIVRGVVKFDS